MAKLEQLICSIGNHKWTRPAGQRGRKPVVCPKHKAVAVVQANSAGQKVQKLHCQIGKHDWERVSVRGKVPLNCPEHKPQPVPSNSTVTTQPNGMVLLHCEKGNHDWERAATRGRKPSNCPDHSGVVADPLVPKRKPGRPKVHDTDEERAAAALKRSTDKVNNLEQMLMANGTHISQQTPYILYRKGAVTKGRGKNPDTVEWILVASHSPLMREQFLNQHEAEFLKKEYRYERENKVVE